MKLIALTAILVCMNSLLSAAEFDITAEDGVPPKMKEQTLSVCKKTTAFFKDTMNIELEDSVKVILVGSKEAYIKAQISENKVTPAEAEIRAQTTTGWSHGNLIIHWATALNDDKQRFFNMSHELVHQLQRQLVKGNKQKIRWLHEGMADAIAAKVIEANRLSTYEKYRKNWFETIKKAASYPSLNELSSNDGWNKVINNYPYGMLYRIADFGTACLVDDKGTKGLIEYHRNLGKGSSPEAAFREVYGIDVDKYEEKVMASLKRRTAIQ